MTNKGLRIENEVFGAEYDWQEISMELGCRLRDDDESGNLCILLRDQGDGTMVRSSPYIHKTSSRLPRFNPRPHTRLLIRKHLNPRQSYALENCHESISFFGEVLRADTYIPAQLQLTSVSPRELWDPDRSAFLTKGLRDFYGVVHFRVVILDSGPGGRNPVGQDFVVATWFQGGGLDQPEMRLATSTERSELYNAVMARDTDSWQPLCMRQKVQPIDVWLGEDRAKQPRRLVDRVKSKLAEKWRFSASPQMSTIMGTSRKHSVRITITPVKA